MKKYSDYRTEDFLTDLLFMDWAYKDNKEAEDFFLHVTHLYPQTADYMREARDILQKIKVEKTASSDAEIEESWADFEHLLIRKQQLLNQKQQKKNVFQHSVFRWGISVAATLLLGISMYFLYNQSGQTVTVDYLTMVDQYVTDPVTMTQDKIRLYLNENDVLSLTKENQIEYKNGSLIVSEKQHGRKKVVMQYAISDSETLNKLVVPNGQQINVTLADGSNLWINSGTTAIYPSSFQGNQREIFVEGEAYLNVFREEARRFTVKTRKMNVAVLGTSFNISAYREDQEQSVVLVNGKVEVERQGETIVLKPNQRYKQNNGRTGIVDQVVATDYACWKDGLMKIDNENINTIFKRLERYYNVTILCDNLPKDLYIQCNGKLNLTEEIGPVLKTIETAAEITIVKENRQYTVKLIKKGGK